MADTYIDYQETQTYGAHFARVVHRRAARFPELGPVAKLIVSATQSVEAEMVRADERRTTRARRVEKKRDVVPEARKVLKATVHWVALNEGEVTLDEFFVDGDTSPRTPAAIVAALKKCSRGFAAHPRLGDAKGRKAAVDAILRRLEDALEATEAAQTGVDDANPALDQARERWLRLYTGAKAFARGVFLMREPRVDVDKLMREFFVDLTVADGPRGKKKRGQAAAPAPESVSG